MSPNVLYGLQHVNIQDNNSVLFHEWMPCPGMKDVRYGPKS